MSEKEINLSKKLNTLPDVIKQAVFDGKISDRQALSLTRLTNEDNQIRVLNKVISHYYTNDAVEDLITDLLQNNRSAQTNLSLGGI